MMILRKTNRLDPALALRFIENHGFKSLAKYFNHGNPIGGQNVAGKIVGQGAESASNNGGAPSALAPRLNQKLKLIRNPAEWQDLRKEIAKIGMVAIHSEADRDGTLIGFGFAYDIEHCFYLPFGHYELTESEPEPTQVQTQGDLLGLKDGAKDGAKLPPKKILQTGQMEKRAALQEIAELLQDEKIIKIGHDIKKLQHYFTEINKGKIVPIADLMLMSFALDAGKYGHEWQNVLKNHDDLLPIENQHSAS